MTTAPTATIGLISNRHSGHNRAHFEKLSALVADCEHIVHIATESAADIPAALAEFAQRQVSIIAINGGDGTVAAILGALLQSRLFPAMPLIVLLPGGTANMTAGDIGVRGGLLKATRRLCEWAAGPQSRTDSTVSRSLLKVRL